MRDTKWACFIALAKTHYWQRSEVIYRMCNIIVDQIHDYTPLNKHNIFIVCEYLFFLNGLRPISKQLRSPFP